MKVKQNMSEKTEGVIFELTILEPSSTNLVDLAVNENKDIEDAKSHFLIETFIERCAVRK